MNNTRPFEVWMKEVDARIERIFFVTSADLPDCCYRDWFDDGVTPLQAAVLAIKNANE